MSLPERFEPEPSDPAAVPDGRADWLVGAEEGIEAELSRRERIDRVIAAPVLIRRGADTPAEPPVLPVPPPAPTPTSPLRAEPPTADKRDDSGFVRGNAMVWESAPSSVPTVRRESTMRPAVVAAAAPGTAREFPMDDAEERARVRAEAREQAAFAAEASVRPHAVVAPDAFDLETVTLPWWMQVPAQIRTDWRLQALLGVVLIALAAVSFWPRGPQPESLGNVNRHPDRFDGHIITVAGRVGDVFEVGGGHAYYLLQNQDTLVVFTRGVAPRRRDKLTLSGTVSTGYLDGQPHLALFELSKD